MTSQSSGESTDVDRKLAQLERDLAARRQAPVGPPLADRAGGAPRAAGAAYAGGAVRGESRLGWRFLIGVVLVLFGAWGVLGNVTVTSGFGGLFGGFFGTTVGGGFGWLFVPIVAGIALIVARTGFVAKVGWFLIVAGIAIMFAQVLSSMRIWFRPIDLPILLLQFAPIGVGLGLMLADVLRARPDATGR